MSISFYVPEWLLWVIGIPVLLAVLFFALLGYASFKSWGGGYWK